MRRIIAFLTGGERVCLRDWEGKHYHSIAYRNPFGEKYASVYWFTKVGHVILNDDGSCRGSSCYVTSWIKE